MYDFDPGETWFLAQIRPNSVHIADRNLQRQGFRTFLPMEERTQKRRDRFVSALRPVFPGYLFVSFDVTRGLWQKINSTSGVSRLVSFGQEPRTVPLDVISQLRQRCDEFGKLMPPKLLRPGDAVRISEGPFADFVARIERIAPDRRVWVLMEIMGGQTRVGLTPEQLTIT